MVRIIDISTNLCFNTDIISLLLLVFIFMFEENILAVKKFHCYQRLRLLRSLGQSLNFHIIAAADSHQL